MNIQIFGRKKCFDTKKAERYFKERRIKYQYIDLDKYGASPGELKSICSSVGFENLVDFENDDSYILKYLAGNEAKLSKLCEMQHVLKTPVVRNGKSATVGYQPDVWKNWQ